MTEARPDERINLSGILIPAQFPKASREDPLSPEKANALRQLAERIRSLGQQQNELTLSIGKALVSAKVLLWGRNFEQWHHREFGMTSDTARSYIAVAKQDAPAKIELVAWDRAEPETSDGVCGYASVTFSGYHLQHCPVFSNGPNGPFIQPVDPSPFKVPDGVWKEEYNQAVLKQIRDVDPTCGLGIGSTSSTPPN
jgi:hypothetical protein